MKTILALYLLLFSFQTNAASCKKVADNSEKLTASSYLRQLLLYARTNDRAREYSSGSQALISYDNKGRKRYSQSPVTVLETAKAEYPLTQAIVKREVKSNFQIQARAQSTNFNNSTLAIKSDSGSFGDLMASPKGSSEAYELYSLMGAAEIISTERAAYIMSSTSTYVRLLQIQTPSRVPSEHPISVKEIDITLYMQRNVPRMMPYGDLIFLGGDELAVLYPDAGVYAVLRMSEDYGRNPVVAMTDLGNGTVSVVRKITQPDPKEANPAEFYKNGYYFVEYVIDVTAIGKKN